MKHEITQIVEFLRVRYMGRTWEGHGKDLGRIWYGKHIGGFSVVMDNLCICTCLSLGKIYYVCLKDLLCLYEGHVMSVWRTCYVCLKDVLCLWEGHVMSVWRTCYVCEKDMLCLCEGRVMFVRRTCYVCVKDVSCLWEGRFMFVWRAGCDCIGLYRTVYDRLWLYMIVFDCIRLPVAIN